MITEKQVEDALDSLTDTIETAAKARAERIYLEEFRKSKKALLMKQHLDLPVNAQEREAYADPEYIKHLGAIKEAVFQDERFRFRRRAAEAVIDAWRTQEATERSRGNLR